MISDFHFIRPYWLLALIPCLVFIILTFKYKGLHTDWKKICDEELLPYILEQSSGSQEKMPLISLSLAAILVVFALSGPAWERIPVPVFKNESALVIALDLSKSMLANDVMPSRLMRARYKISDILTQRKEGKTALIVYAGDAFVVTPLTTDNATIRGQLHALTPDIIPSSGSNTVLALQQAMNLLAQSNLEKGHILLITDEIKVAESVAFVKDKSDYQVSVLAIGTQIGAPIPLPNGGFLKDNQGHIVVPKVIFNDLKQLADAGQGVFQQMTDDSQDIKKLLNAVETSVNNTQEENLLSEQWADKGAWLLLLVLPLVAMNFRRGLLMIPLLCIIPFPKNSYAFEWDNLWTTQNQHAQTLYQQKKYSEAAKLFTNSNWKATSHYEAGEYDQALAALKNEKTATSFSIQGNALAKKGQLEEALQRYNQALALKKDDKETLYNKKLVEKALKKKKENPDPKNSKQKKEGTQNGDKKPASSEGEKAEKQSSENQNNPGKKDHKNDTQANDTQSNQQTQRKQTRDYPLDEKVESAKQWLNRIPDDPSVLLRRKFEYQYKLRQRDDNDPQSW
jgi:Ca-activated chloride channel family protein